MYYPQESDLVYPATIVGKPPMEIVIWESYGTDIFAADEACDFPEIIDIKSSIGGCIHNACLISIKKSYPGQGKENHTRSLGQGTK